MIVESCRKLLHLSCKIWLSVFILESVHLPCGISGRHSRLKHALIPYVRAHSLVDTHSKAIFRAARAATKANHARHSVIMPHQAKAALSSRPCHCPQCAVVRTSSSVEIDTHSRPRLGSELQS